MTWSERFTDFIAHMRRCGMIEGPVYPLDQDEAIARNDVCGRIILALRQFAPNAGGWHHISSAPKDGSWFHAYRAPPATGSWDTLVAVRWSHDDQDFIWPDHSKVCDPFTAVCSDDEWIIDRDYYQSRGTFTHWRPLPAPPSRGAI